MGLEPLYPEYLINFVRTTAIFLLSVSLGQAAGESWFTRVWQTDDGLPNNTVVAIVQTADRMLCLGTPTGIVTFDGFEFRHFSLYGVVGAQNRGIIAMAPMAGEGLVAALDRGAIAWLQGAKTRAWLPDERMQNLTPFAVAHTPDNVTWVSYRNGTLAYLVGDTVSVAQREHGFPAGVAQCALTRDRAGRVWYFKAGQLGLATTKGFTNVLQLPRYPTSLGQALGGGIVIVSGTNIFKYCHDAPNPGMEFIGSLYDPEAEVDPTAVLQSADGAIWVGTRGSGLYRVKDNRCEKIEVSHQTVLALCEDADGNIWVGTGGGGLTLICKRRFSVLGGHQKFSGIVLSMCETPNSEIWAITEEGSLVRWAGREWSIAEVGPGWSNDGTCLVSDKFGRLWLGTRYHGLFCFSNGQFVADSSLAKAESRPIHALCVDRLNRVWVGGGNPASVKCWSNGIVYSFDLPASVGVVRAIAEVPPHIWVGTSRGRLYRITDLALHDETLNYFPEPMSIRYLYATADGRLWIGFAGWGLGCLENGRLHIVTEAQGLFDDFVSQIVDDGQNRLVLGGNRGVFALRLDELTSLFAGQKKFVSSVHYGRNEGLPSCEAVFGYSPGALRAKDGRIFIPTRSGVILATWNALVPEITPSKVLVKRVVVGTDPIAEYAGVLPPATWGSATSLHYDNNWIELPPKVRQLRLEYTVPVFNAPWPTEFRYQLAGLDSNWNITRERAVTYARLPAGKYVFKVAAVGYGNDQLGPVATVGLMVHPSFKETWWFRTLLVLLFGAAMALMARYVSVRRMRARMERLALQMALQEERTRIAKDLHDELGASLTQIALLGELIQKDSERGAPITQFAEKVYKIARATIKSVDEIVWAVNPRNDTLVQLVEYSAQFALDYCRSAGVRCRLTIPENIPDREMPPHLRHALFLSTKEALTNALRHSQATEVELSFQITPDELTVVVADNGCGFAVPADTELPLRGQGIQNMRERMAKLNGGCQIASIRGQGTTVTLKVRLARP